MNIENAISALGHASDSDLVDDVLEAFGCKARPRGDESLVQIFSPDESVCFRFSSKGTWEEAVGEAPKSYGWYILRAIDFEPECGKALPFGLDWGITGARAAELLGTPAKQRGGNQTFYYNGLIIVARYANEKMNKISSIGFVVKDKSHVMHGLAPA